MKKKDHPDEFRYVTEPSEVRNKCIFCKIADGRVKPGGSSKPKELIFESDELVAFDDMSPGAISHCLVIPKKHLKNCWTISPYLLNEMENLGKDILKQRNPDGTKETKMFFIRPPFNSVYHVHLHVMILPLTDSIFNPRRLGFGSYWFHITPDTLRSHWGKK
jgi:diadenosine tetraphosphate (Ap4A) HIT family hydrolase